MLSLIHVELLRRQTKSIYLYSDKDAKPETEPLTSALQGTITAKCVCPDIWNIQRKLDIMPNKTTIRSKKALLLLL